MKPITKCPHCRKIVALEPSLEWIDYQPSQAAIDQEKAYRRQYGIPEQMVFDDPKICPECGTQLERCPECGEFGEMMEDGSYPLDPEYIACSVCESILYVEQTARYAA